MNKVLVCKVELLAISETFIREQVLAYRDWRATLIGLRAVAAGLALDGLDVRLLRSPAPGAMVQLAQRACSRFGVASPRSVWLLLRERAALAHVHFATDAVEFWPMLRWLGRPVVVTLHGYDITTYREFWESGVAGSPLARFPSRLAAMAADARVHFVAVSAAIRQRAIEQGLPAHRVRVHHIGIDPSSFRSAGPPLSQRPFQVLFVGRLVEKKGVAVLIEAFARVHAQVPDAELVVVGDGPLQPELQALALSLRVPVNFAGSMGRDGIKRCLDSSRVFCLPSVRAASGDAEGLPMVLLEAQAAGVPVITSAHGGVEEGLLPGVTGLAFKENDVDTLAAHLQGLLIDTARLERMSHAAVDFVTSRFDIHDCTRALETSYAEIVGTARR